MDKKSIISRNIKFIRESKGLNQSDFAKIIDKGASLISAYEKGVSLPPINIIQLIASEFKYSIDDIVNKDLSQNNYNGKENIDSDLKNTENESSSGSGFYNQKAWKSCIEKADELYELKEAILKVLNMTKIGRKINISQNEVDVLNNFQELGYNKLMKLSFNGLLKKDNEYETFDYVQLLQEINMNIEIANKMLLNYIDDAQYAVFNDEDKRPYLINPENFLHDDE